MIVNAFQARKQVSQLANQLRGQILIEENSHTSAMAVNTIRHLGCEAINGGKIIFLQTGMFPKNLFFGHAMREPAKHIVHSDTHAANTRLARLSVSMVIREACMAKEDSCINYLLSAGDGGAPCHDPLAVCQDGAAC